MENIKETKGEIIIYKDQEGPELKISLQDESVWMSQFQMADLFQKDKNTISEHIQNVYKEAELPKNSTVRKFRVVQTEGKREVLREIEHYNLDVIISVGYRVKSKKGTQFRIWATQKLRDYLLKGYLVNEKRLREAQENRLKELQQASAFIHQAVEAKRLSGYEKELASIINDYTQTWVILNRYDEGDLDIAKQSSRGIKDLDYAKAKKTIEHLRDRLMDHEIANGTFGRERADLLKKTLDEAVKQSNNVPGRASNLFYYLIKNRPFMDGNKRIASLLFVVFLIDNNILYDKKGERRFNDNALIALALLVEETKNSDRDTVINLISQLINKK
ncbi:MAG: virulence RhuM family protein [Candidatus Doudnabacteria bacterium]|nr:virulence RhuM family protein [Candidatus Doudnabacteria bacterium]